MIINFGGDGGGPSWLAPAIVVGFVLVPLMIGLALRLRDRRARAPGVVEEPARRARPGFSLRFTLAVLSVFLVALGFAVAGLGAIALPLAMAGFVAIGFRYGVTPRY